MTAGSPGWMQVLPNMQQGWLLINPWEVKIWDMQMHLICKKQEMLMGIV